MINVGRQITRIIIPSAIVAALCVIVALHFFVGYVLNNVISVIPEHQQNIYQANLLVDIFSLIAIVIVASLFILLVWYKLKKLVDQDIATYLLAIESTSNHIVITDVNGKIIYANKGAEKITGYTVEEMIGNTPRLWGALMPLDFYKNLWQTIKYKRQPFFSEIKNRRKNQEEYYAFVHISPIVDHEKNLVGFVATEEDITELKELDISKTEFISIASHQLRTPMSGLNWLIEGLESDSGNLNPKQRTYLRDLSVLSKRLIILVEDLLNLSRIQLKAPSMVDKARIDIAVFVEQFIGEIDSYATLKKHTIIFNKNTTESTIIETNQKALYNILQNLVSNSIEYSPENTAVTISLDKTADFVKVSVSNKGPLIPRNEQVHLFDKFFRGESSKKMKPEGSGLGLYIVKTMVEEMGGKVGFESEEGKDTMFWFTLPLKKTIVSK